MLVHQEAAAWPRLPAQAGGLCNGQVLSSASSHPLCPWCARQSRRWGTSSTKPELLAPLVKTKLRLLFPSSDSLSLIYQAPHLAFQHTCWLGIGRPSRTQRRERRRWLRSSGGTDLSLGSKTREDTGWTLWLTLVSFKYLSYNSL